MLDPAGSAAHRIAGLWWLLAWISLAVGAFVVALLVVVVRKGRRTRDEGPDIVRTGVPWGDRFIITTGVVVPSVILAGVFLISLRDMNALSAPDSPPAVTIEVEARDWWWEVRYPGTEAVTANEIHIPSGEPVRILLTTGDVIHSFWVPRLQVKKDAVTGTENEMWLEADEPGRYRGQCAEFCGLQHANMIFWVIAEERPDFEAWLANEAAPADSEEAEGEEVFLTSTCVGCHAIRGTPADADDGPDLTHLAARDTLASGVLDNTRTELARWITDPQSIKPGVTMPPTQFTPERLTALLDYLESLD